MQVRMELSRIFIREMTDMQIIELSEVDGERTFPIVIGLPEAFAIERRLKGIEIERPQTHDLAASIIRELGAAMKSVIVTDLRGGTFYANIVLEQDGQEVLVDSRPSDAIALAVAEDVPIFVEDHVLEATSQDKIIGEALSSLGEFVIDDIDVDEDDDNDDDEDEDDFDEGKLNWD